MKIFGILLAFASVMHSIPIKAHNQEVPAISERERLYVDSESVYVGKEGIFWQVTQEQWVPITGIQYDANGMYLTRGGISWFYYVCNGCNRYYEKHPGQCETCGGTSFKYEYEDIWDR